MPAKRVALSLTATTGLALTLVAGCRDTPPGPGAAPSAPGVPVTLEVGLSELERQAWRHTSEGSEVAPLDFLMALDDPESGRPFAESLERFGFIRDPGNPRLPIGFTTRVEGSGPAAVELVGVNCALCHTGLISYQGKGLLIDGAPNLVDLLGFEQALQTSVKTLLADPDEVLAFIKRLIELRRQRRTADPLASNLVELISLSDRLLEDPAFRRRLREDLRQASLLARAFAIVLGSDPADADARLRELFQTDRQEPETRARTERLIAGLKRDAAYLQRRLAYGKRLLDSAATATAFGPGRSDPFGIVRNLLFDRQYWLPLEAPVSTPALFGFGQFVWLHSDGNTNSQMERNVAQAVALGADYDPATHRSSALARNLDALNRIARKLTPPAWPADILGPLDAGRLQTGAALFAQHCESCHAEERLFPLSVIGTDPKRSRSFLVPVGATTFAEALASFGQQVVARLYQDQGIGPEEAARIDGPASPTWRGTGQVQTRRLAAVWATAPYLHNGSVPTLHDLLLPPGERPRSFRLGSREFDPQKVGYRPADTGFVLDVSRPGNSNAGHAYGTTLSAPERDALVEYLKSL